MPATDLPGLAGDLLAPLARWWGSPPPRRAAPGAVRSHLEVRGVHRDGEDAARKQVVEDLHEVPGVHEAVVNAVLGRVVVDHDRDVDPVLLARVVAGAERDHGLAGADPAPASAHHPADPAAFTRQVVALAVDLAGLSVVGAERLLGALPVSTALPPLATGLLSLADAVPAARSAAERTVGGSATESWFSLGSASAQALGRGPVGLVADACYRALRAGEASSRAAAWAAFDRDAPLPVHAADPVAGSPRPAPLPPGPVERVGDAAGVAALGGLGAALALLPARSAAVLLAGVPKAGRWGREAYAAAAHRALGDDGVVVVDPTAMRRADRARTVVVDAGLAAVAGPALVAAAAGVGEVLVVHGPTAGVVADRQRAGDVVVLVAADDAEGLAAADVAIGVGVGGGEPPWSAAVRCRSTRQACAVLRAVAGARAASRRAAALALLGSVLAAPVAVGGELSGLGARTNLPVTLAALAALGVNAAAGRAAARP